MLLSATPVIPYDWTKQITTKNFCSEIIGSEVNSIYNMKELIPIPESNELSSMSF